MQPFQPAPDEINPSPGIPEGGLDRLQKMLAHLPKNQHMTALACWEGFGNWDIPVIDGVEHAAWFYAGYQKTWTRGVSKGPSLFPAMKPHLVEKELGRVAADARAILSKLTNLSPESLNLIHSWLGENEPWWGPEGTKLLELEDLARDMEKLATWAAGNKQAPNGRRKGVSGRLAPVERLIFDIGQMVSFRKGKVTHILPIARVIHEWATGEIPGPTWGQRPFDQVKPRLEALNWDHVSDEERIPAPTPPHDPEAGKRRLERLKASLRAHPEAAAK